MHVINTFCQLMVASVSMSKLYHTSSVFCQSNDEMRLLL